MHPSLEIAQLQILRSGSLSGCPEACIPRLRQHYGRRLSPRVHARPLPRVEFRGLRHGELFVLARREMAASIGLEEWTANAEELGRACRMLVAGAIHALHRSVTVSASNLRSGILLDR